MKIEDLWYFVFLILHSQTIEQDPGMKWIGRKS